MDKVILDADMRAKLNGLNRHLELCDESGRTVGHFLPVELYQKLVSGALTVPYSEVEMQRRRQEAGGRPLHEFWQERGRG